MRGEAGSEKQREFRMLGRRRVWSQTEEVMGFANGRGLPKASFNRLLKASESSDRGRIWVSWNILRRSDRFGADSTRFAETFGGVRGSSGYKELQELHSALEEAKADIVGLWALRFLITQKLLPRYLLRSMYVSFLAGCFRSVRFGLEEAHGKGQALQFNWLYDKEAFILHSDGTFSVDFEKVEAAVEDLSREILTIQARGDKVSAKSLLQGYAKMTQPLSSALEKLERVQVPVDIAPTFGVLDLL